MLRQLLVVLLLCLGLSSCKEESKADLQQILARGQLRVALPRDALDSIKQGDTQLEYELAQRFARRFGLDLQLIPTDTPEDSQRLLRQHQVDLAMGLAVTVERQREFRFAPAYQQIQTYLVYRQGNKVPKSLNQLPGRLVISSQSHHAELLSQLKSQYPDLAWQQDEDLSQEELAEQIVNGQIELSLIDSSLLTNLQRVQPELVTAMALGPSTDLAWALAPSSEDSLQAATLEFFSSIHQNGLLAQLSERFYGQIGSFDSIDARSFIEAATRILPRYKLMFQEAEQGNLDWRLLAAVGYQESRWNPTATSPTGVRGMMMLTMNTSRHVQVTDRTDARQSIQGGSRYLQQIEQQLQEEIQGQDRLWMMLAAYNIGPGLLEQTRRKVQRRGGDANRWQHVQDALKANPSTRHAAKYVEKVRHYYEILSWLERQPKTSLLQKQAG